VEPAAPNPYAAPASINTPPPWASGAPKSAPANGKEPFSLQAAKFSAYAPFVLFLMNCCVRGPLEDTQGTQDGMLLASMIFGICLLTTLAALVLGFVGLKGGISRRSVRTILYAAAGILLNAGVLTMTAMFFLRRW
jgi:hypothetical protein